MVSLIEEVETPLNLSSSQPHAVYAAYVHGLQSKWIYFYRINPDIADIM